MGKHVIVIDLSPISRSAKAARITIVDNFVRGLPKLIEIVEYHHNTSHDRFKTMIEGYDNNRILAAAMKKINERLLSLIDELTPLSDAAD